VASVTKAFTGVALLSLVDAGRLDLDAPVQRYVPAFPGEARRPDHPAPPRRPPRRAAPLAGRRAHPGALRHALRRRRGRARAVPGRLPRRAAGARYGYSSPGYNLLAAAIQAASGERFEDYVARVVLRPLGLADTGFDDVRRVNPHRARRYAYYDPYTFAPDTARVFRVPEWDYSHNPGGGNMYSTAEDLGALRARAGRPRAPVARVARPARRGRRATPRAR
jgi:CubicO group peptidase (beta-lactamase class C family)